MPGKLATIKLSGLFGKDLEKSNKQRLGAILPLLSCLIWITLKGKALKDAREAHGGF